MGMDMEKQGNNQAPQLPDEQGEQAPGVAQKTLNVFYKFYPGQTVCRTGDMSDIPAVYVVYQRGVIETSNGGDVFYRLRAVGLGQTIECRESEIQAVDVEALKARQREITNEVANLAATALSKLTNDQERKVPIEESGGKLPDNGSGANPHQLASSDSDGGDPARTGGEQRRRSWLGRSR